MIRFTCYLSSDAISALDEVHEMFGGHVFISEVDGFVEGGHYGMKMVADFLWNAGFDCDGEAVSRACFAH